MLYITFRRISSKVILEYNRHTMVLSPGFSRIARINWTSTRIHVQTISKQGKFARVGREWEYKNKYIPETWVWYLSHQQASQMHLPAQDCNENDPTQKQQTDLILHILYICIFFSCVLLYRRASNREAITFTQISEMVGHPSVWVHLLLSIWLQVNKYRDRNILQWMNGLYRVCVYLNH